MDIRQIDQESPYNKMMFEREARVLELLQTEGYLKTGEKGLLYNIHYQLNPERIEKTNHDCAGVIVKKIDMGEY